MRIFFFLPLLSLILPISALATESYTIYLVRHAEKAKTKDDPSLTACGKERAKQLATMLSKAGIKKIYSSSYQRTRQTATPLAKAKNIAVQYYNPRHLPELAIQLQQRKENSLIVGHSNTTPQLVELLSKQTLNPLTENDYQHLYQVQFISGSSVVTLLKQPLICL